MNNSSVPAALFAEPILDPDLPICDAHHHLWDRPESRYLVPEYIADISSGHNIVSTVFVECAAAYRTEGPWSLRPVGETVFAHAAGDLAARSFGRSGVCAGIVAFADLTLGSAVEAVLDAHLEASNRLRGIRHCAAWDASPHIRSAHAPVSGQMLANSRFREGFAALAKRRLTFDAWVYHPQIFEVVGLAKTFPDTPIILDHLGGPLGIGPYANRRSEIVANWASAIDSLATCPNVLVKLGGINMPLNGWGYHRRNVPPSSEEVALQTREYYLRVIDRFGPERCLFESNFPADRSSLSYGTLWNALKRIVSDFSAAEKRAMFQENAVRSYRLG